MRDLRQYLKLLAQENELAVITEEVDPALEIAEIHRRVVQNGGKALLFKNVKNSVFPVVTNLFGTEKRVSLAFPSKPEQCIESVVALATREFPPTLKTLWKRKALISSLFRLGTRSVQQAPVTECLHSPPNLNLIPLIKSWLDDGGHFITLPLVYTEHPETKTPNLGMYRIQRFDSTTTGLHMQIGKGGGFHLAACDKNQPLPVSIFIGGPPALIFSAIAPLPENVSELLLASLLANQKIEQTGMPFHPHPLIAHAEFALLGHAHPEERRLEGPFGDHYGYYSLAHEFPVFHCTHMLHRKDAIYPATVVGKPPQEDIYIGNFLQKLFSPIISLVMPHIKELHTFGETGFHPLAAARIHERYERESLSCAFRILGEGQLSLTKFLILTDQPIEIQNIRIVLETVLARFDPRSDLHIFAHTANDTLDYTGPALNKGSKAVLIGVGDEKRALPKAFIGNLPRGINKAIAFCKGCLILDGPPYNESSDIGGITQHPDFAHWPLLILVDNAETITSSSLEFLWGVFTRFEPAQDISTKEARPVRHRLAYELPLLIDARMKPWYPPETVCDEETRQRVDRRWEEYFTQDPLGF